MPSIRFLLPAAAALLLCTSATATPRADPLHFFEGRTEGSGIVRIIMKKPYRTRSVGLGRIERDGSLSLVQRVEDEGRPPRERKWKIRKVGPSRYSGTMTEAVGPVSIEEVAGRYRFRFKMKGHLSVEQWMAPQPGGMAALNNMTVRKLGMTVGTSEGMIRKFASR